MNKINYFAHSANPTGEWHPLIDHLRSVAKFTGNFLEGWKSCSEGQLAALLHDLGKYGDLFQQRLMNPNRISGLDHWSQGAWVAVKDFHLLAAAFAIQGHHIGLQSWNALRGIQPEKLEKFHPMNLRLSEPNINRLVERLKADGIEPEKPQYRLLDHKPGQDKQNISNMLDIRRLFSALVDADFIDTEAHFQGNTQGKVYRNAGPVLEAEKSLGILLDKINELTRTSKAPPHVNEVRLQLLNDCLASANSPTGLFTLTAPTGSGKTLSMLAFALKHAREHGLRRVVMVIPYLTIIEQTANIYRDLFTTEFGEDYVLEHHSMAGMGAETTEQDSVNGPERRRRLLAENWDAPIIITTSVQLLESLFSNRPSSCRKLHRLAESVILFDEIQTLPVQLAVPTLAALSHLAKNWNSSVVLSTATQPAFDHLNEKVRQYVDEGWQPREIVRQPQMMADRLRRVNYDFPKQGEDMGWDALAQQLSEVEQGLCIVNLKKHAKILFESMTEIVDEGLYHLSTNLCPLHRRAVLDEVRERLKTKRPCRLIATQCVEAGVDVDFPNAWRAIGPLDSIIQAAGRCNREGLQESGEMRVFVPEETPYPPMPGYFQATKVTEKILNSLGRDHFDPYDSELIERYYRELYQISDPAGQKRDLVQAIMDFDFPEVARNYRLIEQDAINILVPWSGALTEYQKLHKRAEDEGLSRDWIRRARPLSVSLFRPKPDDAVWDALMPISYLRGGKTQRNQQDWFVYLRTEDYDDNLGLKPPETLHLWIA